MTSAVWAAALTGWVLVPFGNVTDRVAAENPWRGFDSDEAKLVVARAQRVDGAECTAWTRAMETVARQDGIGPIADAKSWELAWKIWKPFNEDELDDIRSCDDKPCKVKLGPAEIQQMAAAAKNSREAKYLELIAARAEGYRPQGVRKEYEFPGDPVEPWSYLAGRGFKTDLVIPKAQSLWVRKTELAPGKAKALHQVVDRRVTASADHREAVYWARDVYTDHYFDSWGEWARVSCETVAGKKSVLVVQALFVELDLLKKTDLVSRIMRGKMKSGVESQGNGFLDRFFSALEAQVKTAKSAPVKAK